MAGMEGANPPPAQQQGQAPQQAGGVPKGQTCVACGRVR